jgi:class 3 adenylate cyclase
LLNSKEILEQTGISRATLNNYIGWGIVPKPEVLPPEPQDGGAPRIGYFPDEILERIAEIQRLKKEGWSMTRIAEHFGARQAPGGTAAQPPRPADPAPGVEPRAAAPQRPVAHEAPAPAAATPDTASRRRPVLTDVAVLVAGLQHSSRIWAQLPPQEYFELINDIWSAVDPVFRRHAGTHGRHPADGMVCYFFPLPAGSYLWNALAAAQETREAMKRVSKEWQLRKGWPTELYMNVGLDEGQEWLGSLRSDSTVGFTAFAETINQAARISNFSRFGAIWATKNLLGKLSPEERQRLKYGVHRKTGDGRHVFVPSIFADVHPPASQATDAGGEPPRPIALQPITEIVDISADKGR